MYPTARTHERYVPSEKTTISAEADTLVQGTILKFRQASHVGNLDRAECIAVLRGLAHVHILHCDIS
jgi:hypothetical protein